MSTRIVELIEQHSFFSREDDDDEEKGVSVEVLMEEMRRAEEERKEEVRLEEVKRQEAFRLAAERAQAEWQERQRAEEAARQEEARRRQVAAINQMHGGMHPANGGMPGGMYVQPGQVPRGVNPAELTAAWLFAKRGRDRVMDDDVRRGQTRLGVAIEGVKSGEAGLAAQLECYERKMRGFEMTLAGGQGAQSQASHIRGQVELFYSAKDECMQHFAAMNVDPQFVEAILESFGKHQQKIEALPLVIEGEGIEEGYKEDWFRLCALVTGLNGGPGNGNGEVNVTMFSKGQQRKCL